MNRAGRALCAAVVLAGAVAGTVVAVRASNGDYAGQYRLTGYFPAAGEGLVPGSEVAYRGVQVGRVAAISLAGSKARVTLLIDRDFAVPGGSSATIAPVNLFGAEQVTLRLPRPATRGPDLAPGATLARTATGDELSTLFQAAAPLLEHVTTKSLASVIGDLAQAADGEGPIRRQVETGASLAAYLDQTLTAQVKALDSFSSFSAAVAGDGPAVNGLSAAENVALPAFNQEAAAYSQVLSHLTAFSSKLAALLTDYHPTLVTLLSDGDNPVRVLTAQQTQIGQTVSGLYHYARKIGSSKSAQALPTGSHFVYFATFIVFTDVNSLVCDLIAPPAAGLAVLEPLQQALTGSGSAFTCASQLAAFNALQAPGTALVTPTPSTATTPAPTAASVPNPVTAATGTLVTTLYGIVGQPSTTTPTPIATYVTALLGGGL